MLTNLVVKLYLQNHSQSHYYQNLASVEPSLIKRSRMDVHGSQISEIVQETIHRQRKAQGYVNENRPSKELPL